MNPHLLRKFRQRRDVLGIIDIIRNGRFIGDFTRATTRTYFDSTGTLQTAAINTLPWEYDPATLAPIGFSFWEARTNLLLQSAFAASWTSSAAAVTAAAVNWPAGASSGATLVEDGTTAAHSIYQNVTKAASSIQYVFSVFAKPGAAGSARNLKIQIDDAIANGATVTVNPSTGAVVTAASTFGSGFTAGNVNPVALNSGGYRFDFTVTTNTATTVRAMLLLMNGATQSYAGDSASGLQIYGAQLEAGAAVTPHIATTSAAVARSADVASLSGAGFSSLGIGTSGTIVTSFTPGAFPASGATFVVAASDGTSNNVIEQRAIVGGIFDYRVATGGVTQFDSTGVSAVAGTNYKQASAYSINDFAASIGGAASETDISGTVPTIDRLYIGSENGAAQCNGWIDYLGVIPGRQADYILQGRSQ